MKRVFSNSPQETETYGFRLGQGFTGGEILFLTGVLGSGKTTLAKGVGTGLGVDEVITSPSFAIMNEYRGRLDLFHFDFYRLEDTREMEDLLEEYLYREDGVVVVEWGDPVMKMLDSYIHVSLNVRDGGRTITREDIR
jgi:tRNA threonylcarbamoyladenosine biosynthesis protein TsaE